jgi:hypothetical protein
MCGLDRGKEMQFKRGLNEIMLSVEEKMSQGNIH